EQPDRSDPAPVGISEADFKRINDLVDSKDGEYQDLNERADDAQDHLVELLAQRNSHLFSRSYSEKRVHDAYDDYLYALDDVLNQTRQQLEQHGGLTPEEITAYLDAVRIKEAASVAEAWADRLTELIDPNTRKGSFVNRWVNWVASDAPDTWWGKLL